MSTRSLRRPAGLVTAVMAAVMAVGLVVGLAQARNRPAPARAGGVLDRPASACSALDGLEDLVGAIDPLVRAQLPLDPRIYGSYTTRPTPSRCANGSFTCIDRTIADMTTPVQPAGAVAATTTPSSRCSTCG